MSADLSSAQRASGMILIVDDEAALVEGLCDYLRNQGYQVVGTTSRSEALALAREHRERLALVIMDVILNEDLGPLIVDEMLQISRSLRVLYLSGFAQDDALYNSEAKLPLAFLRKPCPLKVVSTTVDNLLHGH